MPCPYRFCLVILRGDAILRFRCYANRLKSKNFFIREIRSGPRSRAIRKWRRRPTRRGIDFGPVQFNLRSNAHQLLLFISVLSVSSVLKSEKPQHREHRESQRTTEKSRCILSPCLAVRRRLVFAQEQCSSSHTPIRSPANALPHVREHWQIPRDSRCAQFARHPSSPSAGTPRALRHDCRTTSRRAEKVTGGRCQVSGYGCQVVSCRCQVLGYGCQVLKFVGCPILRGFREGWGFCLPLPPVPHHLLPAPESVRNASASQSHAAAWFAKLLPAPRGR